LLPDGIRTQGRYAAPAGAAARRPYHIILTLLSTD
jgi:hypothetical protein